MESHAGFELPRDVDVGVNALHRAKSNCAAHARRAVGSVLPRKTASPWTGSFVESAERRSLPTRCWLRRHAAISVSQPRALEGLCAFAAPADVINRVADAVPPVDFVPRAVRLSWAFIRGARVPPNAPNRGLQQASGGSTSNASANIRFRERAQPSVTAASTCSWSNLSVTTCMPLAL
jgi:hypothetical protein